VLVVHPHFHPRRTGVTSHTEAIVAALAKGTEVAALGEALSPSLPLTTLREVFRRARREPVVWHAHRNNELLWGLLLRAFGAKLELVFTRHGGSVPGAFSRWLLRFPDAIVTLNDELAAHLPPGTRVIGHGVDLARFQPPASREAAWKALGVPGARGFGVVGRVRPAKGQADFVEALAALPGADVTPVLVGLARGADQAWSEGLRARLPTLVLVGEQPDVVRWYQGLDVVVQPSHSESFSLVIPEAMACGCAVVATRLPAAPGLIDDGRTGFLYPPGDLTALREVLGRLVAEPSLARRVGQAAAEEARARFGVEHEARALLQVYRQVAQLPQSGVE
jgi:mannosyltransferase